MKNPKRNFSVQSSCKQGQYARQNRAYNQYV